MTPEKFAAMLGGAWERPPPTDWQFLGLCSNPSTWRPGQSVLIKSPENRHGIAAGQVTAQMGPGGFIVARQGASPRVEGPVMRVESVQDALRVLAHHLRSHVNAKLIAVTGTVGKTTSCHLLQHVIGSSRLSMNGQLNSSDGVLCEMGRFVGIDYAVTEISLQALAGDSGKILRPHIGLLTHVSPVHTASRVDLQQLTREKAQLFRYLAPGGTAVINRDIEHFDLAREIALENSARIITFGVHSDSDFSLARYESAEQKVTARLLGDEYEFRLSLRGRHMAINSLGILAAAAAADISLSSAIPRLATASAVRGRGSIESIRAAGREFVLIDDSYNASPASMEAAFANLGSLSSTLGGRRIAVLADMLELGEGTASFHERLLDPLLAAGVDKVFLAGEMMQILWARLPEHVRGKWSASASSLFLPLARELQDGDIVLLKGSHGTGVHLLVDELRYLSLIPDILARSGNGGLAPFAYLARACRATGNRMPPSLARWAGWQFRKRLRATA